MLRTYVCFFLFCATSLSAYTHARAGGLTVEAAYLYLLPSVDNTYFVISADNVDERDGPADGQNINNDFGFHSAFRVGASYGFCGCDYEVQGYYTHLNAHTSTKVTSPFYLFGPNLNGYTNFTAYSGEATSDNHLLYQRADAFFVKKGTEFCTSTFWRG